MGQEVFRLRNVGRIKLLRQIVAGQIRCFADNPLRLVKEEYSGSNTKGRATVGLGVLSRLQARGGFDFQVSVGPFVSPQPEPLFVSVNVGKSAQLSLSPVTGLETEGSRRFPRELKPKPPIVSSGP